LGVNGPLAMPFVIEFARMMPAEIIRWPEGSVVILISLTANLLNMIDITVISVVNQFLASRTLDYRIRPFK
jgi:hypothetical protein